MLHIKTNNRFLRFGVLLIFFSTLLISCVESFELSSETPEATMVIESVITDELKHQQVKLALAGPLNSEESIFETKASVNVLSSTGEIYTFKEDSAGYYSSVDQFRVEANQSYHLEVQTNDGSTYRSTGRQMVEISDPIQIVAQRQENEEQVGAAIYAINNSGSENRYYKYTFEETYKIEATYVASLKFGNSVLDLVPVEEEQRICYASNRSQEILLNNFEYLENDRTNQFLIQFIPNNDRRLFERYSIYVNRLSISPDAYRFFRILRESSIAENIFSQRQLGFIEGNITSVNDPDENVVGFFEVASHSSQRIFFNYTDLFNASERPSVFEGCEVTRPPLTEVVSDYENGQIQFLSMPTEDGNPDEGDGPYRVVPIECVDCRELGSNEQPDFWIE